jgi:hypothetical protein
MRIPWRVKKRQRSSGLAASHWVYSPKRFSGQDPAWPKPERRSYPMRKGHFMLPFAITLRPIPALAALLLAPSASAFAAGGTYTATGT